MNWNLIQESPVLRTSRGTRNAGWECTPDLRKKGASLLRNARFEKVGLLCARAQVRDLRRARGNFNCDVSSERWKVEKICCARISQRHVFSRVFSSLRFFFASNVVYHDYCRKSYRNKP